MKKIAGLILKELLVQIILSTVLVVILAFIVFELSLGDGIIRIMILAIYGICSLVGGLILGKNIQKRKFLWGLVAGAIYIGLIMGKRTGEQRVTESQSLSEKDHTEQTENDRRNTGQDLGGKFNEGNRPQNIVKKRLNLYHIVL